MNRSNSKRKQNRKETAVFFCYLESSITIGNTTQNQQHDRMMTVTYKPNEDIQKHFFDWVQKCRKDIEAPNGMCVIRDCKIITV